MSERGEDLEGGARGVDEAVLEECEPLLNIIAAYLRWAREHGIDLNMRV